MSTKIKNTISKINLRKAEFIIALFLIAVTLGGCINLREDYPEITYYSLEPSKGEPARSKVDGVLQVRPFGGSNLISSRRFIVEKSVGGFDKFYYHRWSDDFQELFTWAVINDMSARKAFTGGVVNQGTALVPNYILEGDILGLRMYNDEKDHTDSSFVELSVKVSLLGFDSANSLKVIYTNLYNKKVTRKTNRATTIAPAVNSAANEIISLFTEDIIKSINK
jgi:ABC-type uncharacterized transport system auxiliary subunit